MLRFENSIVIDAPVEDVFTYLVEPKNWPEYFVGIDDVKDIQRLPDGGYTCKPVGKFAGVHFEGTTHQIAFVPNERIVVSAHSALWDGTLTLRFEKLESRKTLVRGLSEYEIGGGPLAKFGDPFLARYFDHEAEMSLEAAKAHIEIGTPAAASR